MASEDINRGYLSFINRIAHEDGDLFRFSRRLLSLGYSFLRLLSIPLLFAYGSILVLALVLRTASTRKKLQGLHKRALSFVDDFIEQYPFHLYPIVAKSLELAFLKKVLPEYVLLSPHGVVEMAIGDGSLSRRIFAETDNVMGFDLNPYSLIHTSRLSHVKTRVVSDCMNPPLSNNSVSLLVSNNFLHHVSDKEYVLSNWAKIADVAVFNENTPYWASGWTIPFILRTLKLDSLAKRSEDAFLRRGLQTLLPAEDLRKTVSHHFEILEEATFLSERTFFLCSLTSFFLGCYGPPTPRLPKKIFNTLLRPLAHGLTALMAKALIRYDALQPRNRDAFIFWVGRSKAPARTATQAEKLVCPDCRSPIRNATCPRCNIVFPEEGGMLFLLPSAFRKQVIFDLKKADLLGKEHL